THTWKATHGRVSFKNGWRKKNWTSWIVQPGRNDSGCVQPRFGSSVWVNGEATCDRGKRKKFATSCDAYRDGGSCPAKRKFRGMVYRGFLSGCRKVAVVAVGGCRGCRKVAVKMSLRQPQKPSSIKGSQRWLP